VALRSPTAKGLIRRTLLRKASGKGACRSTRKAELRHTFLHAMCTYVVHTSAEGAQAHLVVKLHGPWYPSRDPFSAHAPVYAVCAARTYQGASGSRHSATDDDRQRRFHLAHKLLQGAQRSLGLCRVTCKLQQEQVHATGVQCRDLQSQGGPRVPGSRQPSCCA